MTTQKKTKRAPAPKGSNAAKASEPRIRTERFEGPASDWGDEVLVDLDEPVDAARASKARSKK